MSFHRRKTTHPQRQLGAITCKCSDGAVHDLVACMLNTELRLDLTDHCWGGGGGAALH